MASNRETIQSMLEMPIGTDKMLGSFIQILRVPGGWMYTRRSDYTRETETSIFVPEPVEIEISGSGK